MSNTAKVITNDTGGALIIKGIAPDPDGLGLIDLNMSVGEQIDLSTKFNRVHTNASAGLDNAITNGKVTVDTPYTAEDLDSVVADLALKALKDAGALPADPAAPAALTSSQEAQADASAPSAGYVQAEAVSAADLANSLKAKYNQAQADIAALRAEVAAAITQLAAIKAKVDPMNA